MDRAMEDQIIPVRMNKNVLRRTEISRINVSVYNINVNL